MTSRDALRELEQWSSSGKEYSCEVRHDDGYGCCPWTCVLRRGGTVVVDAVECPEPDMFGHSRFVYSDTEDYEGFLVSTAASDKTLWVRCRQKTSSWPGPRRVILAAIDAAGKLMEVQS